MHRARRRYSHLVPLAFAVGSLLHVGCLNDVSGPVSPVVGSFSIVPSFQSVAAGIVDLRSVRVLVHRRTDESLALDTVIPITPGSDSLALELGVEVETTGETYELTVLLLNSEGDTSFSGGPVTIAPTTSHSAVPTPVNLGFEYVGVGWHARHVRIRTTDASVITNDTATVIAEALDRFGQVIPGTPIAWISLDTTLAYFHNPALGQVIGGPTRCQTEMVASLITGQVDTTVLFVQPRPNAIVVSEGDGQTGTVGNALPAPVSLVAIAPDSLGVAGVKVVFQLGSDGSFAEDTVTTDSTGTAELEWTLGGTAGTQTASVLLPEAPGVQATFTATAVAAEAQTLQIVSGNGQADTVATQLQNALTVRVLDGYGNTVSGHPVRFAVRSGGGSLSTDSTVTDQDGLANTFWTLGTSTSDSQTVRAIISDSLTNAGLDSIEIVATPLSDDATSVLFDRQPGDEAAGTANFAELLLLDQYGNVATGDSSTAVRLSILPLTGTAAASLTGATSTTALAGRAVFDAFSIDSVGNGYRLLASAGVAFDTSTAFDIVPGSLDTILLAPSALRHSALGSTTTFTTVARDASGNEIPDVSVSWSLSDSSIASISADGTVTGTANGTVLVTASSGGVSGAAWFIVEQEVDSLTIQPASATIGSGGATHQFTASAYDSNGIGITNIAFEWALSDSSIATIDASGLVTSVAEGTTQVMVSADGLTETVILTVSLLATAPPRSEER